jgi:hypothetical protein
MSNLTREEAAEIANDAAQRAVDAVMLRLGIDPHDPESLARARNNLQFLARMNRGATQVSNAIVKTCAGAAITAILWLLGVGLKEWLMMK